MWQKCWNSQNLIHHLRFRERGPLKSWRPETMAEAIFSVLKEGLSLSQAARKYDIPYPTFVLYANRVHNMLGPSIDGGTDLRPKGRGRPQRILLGIWPDDHIKGVIKSVVFRDTKEIKDDSILYGRHSPFPFQDNPLNYAPNANGQLQPGVAGAGPNDGMTQDALTAATVAAVRQQMCNMVAAAQHHPDAAANLVGFNLQPPHPHSNLSIHPSVGNNGAGGSSGIPVPKLGSPAVHNNNGGGGGVGGGIQMPRLGSPAGSSLATTTTQGSKEHDLQQHLQHHGGNVPSSTSTNSRGSNSHPSSNHHPHHPLAHLNSGSLSITRLGSPASAHDLRLSTPPTEDRSPLPSPMAMILEPAVNLAVGGGPIPSSNQQQQQHHHQHHAEHLNQTGGMPPGYGTSSKSSSRAGYSSSSSPPRPEHLFQDQDLTELVAAQRNAAQKDQSSSSAAAASASPRPAIKMEPMTECRAD
uniref:Protein bric-a-brac 1 n=2 Tax=Culex pipiens TaxID=7175 RepID=A0A8D8NFH9_CULPI